MRYEIDMGEFQRLRQSVVRQRNYERQIANRPERAARVAANAASMRESTPLMRPEVQMRIAQLADPELGGSPELAEAWYGHMTDRGAFDSPDELLEEHIAYVERMRERYEDFKNDDDFGVGYELFIEAARKAGKEDVVRDLFDQAVSSRMKLEEEYRSDYESALSGAYLDDEAPRMTGNPADQYGQQSAPLPQRLVESNMADAESAFMNKIQDGYAKLAAEAETKEEGFWGESVVGSMRNALTVAMFPYEVVTAGLRQVGVQTDKLPGPVQTAVMGPGAQNAETGEDPQGILEQTTLGQATNWSDTGEGLSTGKGFLPSGPAVEAQAEAARKTLTVTDPAGTEHGWTIGRQVAAGVPAPVLEQVGRVPQYLSTGLHHVVSAPGRPFGADPGKGLEFRITEPEMAGYNVLSGAVDAAAIMKLDPINIAGRSIKTIRAQRNAVAFSSDAAAKARREAAGVFDTGGRRWAHPPTVDDWLRTDGADFLHEMAAARPKDFERLRSAFGNDVQTLRTLIDEDTPEGVYRALRQAAPQMTDRPKNIGAAVNKTPPSQLRRMFSGRLPRNSMGNLSNPDEVAEQMSRYMQLHQWHDDEIGRVIYDLAGQKTPSGRLNVYHRMLDMDAKHLEDLFGFDAVTAKKVTSYARDINRDASLFSVDAHGHNLRLSDVDTLALNGEQADDVLRNAEPFWPADSLRAEVYLPSNEDFVAAMTQFKPLLGSRRLQGALHKSRVGLEAVQSQTWVPLQLLRFAWTVRVIGEEQMRMAAAGASSMFHHPLDHIAIAMGKKITRDIPSRGSFRNSLDDVGVLSGRRQQFYKPSGMDRVVAKHYTQVPRSNGRYAEGWADELSRAGSDQVGRRLAYGETVDDLTDWVLNDPKAKGYRDLVGEMNSLDMTDPVTVRRMVEAKAEQLRRLTSNGDPRLRALVATGRYTDDVDVARGILDGDEIKAMSYDAFDDLEEVGALVDDSPFDARRLVTDEDVIDPDVVSALDARRIDGPEFTRVADEMTVRGQGGLWERTTDWLFAQLMQVPTNKLSRAPYYQTRYWERAIDFLPAMDDTARKQMLAAARKANLPKRLQTKLRKTAATASFDDDVLRSFDDLEPIIKARALDDTRDLLYDLNERSRFFEATRLIFPFGEAWKEVLTRWGNLVKADPTLIRKGQIALTGLRSEGAGETMELVGATPDMGDLEAIFGTDAIPGLGQSGFFHTDPATGEEVFVYPWSHVLSSALTGVPIPMTGRAAGLNIAMGVFPGVGPAIQFSEGIADRLGILNIGNVKNQEWYRWAQDNVIAPFGSVSTAVDIPSGIVEEMMPTWMGHMYTAVGQGNIDNKRLYDNTVANILSYRQSVGEIDMRTDDPEKIADYTDDASKAATTLYFLRGALAFGAPTAPSPRWLVEADDQIIMLQAARDYMYWLREENPDDYMDRWMDTFGSETAENLLFAVTPKTKTVVYGVPLTKEAVQHVDENPWLPEEYEHVYGYFVPQEGEFDYPAYLRSLLRGEREVATTDEWRRHVLHVMGTYWYDQGRDRLGLVPGDTPTAEQSEALRQFRDTLEGGYGNYEDDPYASVRTENGLQLSIQELERAVDDPRLADHPAIEAIKDYLDKRARVIDFYEEDEGQSRSRYSEPIFVSGNARREGRQALRWEANRILENTPEFSVFWENIFSRELHRTEADDLEDEAA